FSVARWRDEQCSGSNDDRSLVSLQSLLVNSRHFWIAWNDVARSVIGGHFDQHAAMLRHRESDHCLIFHDINLRLADVEVGCRLRCGYGSRRTLDDATRAWATTRLSSRSSSLLLCIQH